MTCPQCAGESRKVISEFYAKPLPKPVTAKEAKSHMKTKRKLESNPDLIRSGQVEIKGGKHRDKALDPVIPKVVY